MNRIHWRTDFSKLLLSRISPVRSAVTLMISGLIASVPQASLATSLTKLSGIVPGYQTSGGLQDIPTADFDGDGLADVILLGSSNYSDVMQIAGFQAGSGWKIKQAIVPESPDNFYSATIINTWTDAGGAHLLYVRDRLVSIYSGWPLALSQQFQVDSGNEFDDAIVADVDNDGAFELVTTKRYSSPGLFAYSIVTGAPIWSAAIETNYYSKLHVGQVDGDPALEIFLTGNPGSIVDGATRSVEWVYKDGFAPLLEIGRFGGASNGFASIGYSLLMFQSQPWSPLWDMLNVYARSSSVADLDGDNVDELVVSGEVYPRGLSVIDVQTQSIRSTFEKENIKVIAAANFDSDADTEIALGLTTGSPSYQPNSFEVISAISGASEFSLPAKAPGPYFAAGFVADTGTVDLVLGSGSGTDYAGAITRMDATTGAIRWSISGNDPLISMNTVRELRTTMMAGHAQPVVLASGSGYSNYWGQVAALDTSNGSFLWSLSSAQGSFPDSISVQGMAAVDLDNDTLTDSVLLCTSESRLRLFDTTTQAQVWSSVAMSSGCRGAMQMNSGGRQQLVAVLDAALRAYDAQTHLLSWSLPFPNGLIGATYLMRGEVGPELALFDSYGITFYDAETRVLLRELTFTDQFPVWAVAQPDGASIHELVVAANGKVCVVDGISGELHACSEAIGLGAGQGNQLAVQAHADGSTLIGVGSEVAVFTLKMDGPSDEIFVNGFDFAVP